jgi:hypothetical protein
MKEVLETKTKNMETLTPTEKKLGEKFVDPKELAEAANRAEADRAELQKSIVEDQQASGQKYEEVKGTRIESQEEIKARHEKIQEEIKQKEEEIKQRNEDYKSLVNISSTDTGLSSGNFSGSSVVGNLIKRYPGLEQIANLMSAKNKQSKAGWKFWKTPAMNEKDANVIQKRLLMGSFYSLHPDPNYNWTQEDRAEQAKFEAQQREMFDKFVAANNPEAKEGEVVEVASAREVIAAEIPKLKAEIEKLQAELSK